MSGGIFSFFGIGKGHTATQEKSKPKSSSKAAAQPQYVTVRIMTPEQSREMKQAVHRHIEIRQEMDKLSQNIVDAKQREAAAKERGAQAGIRAAEADKKVLDLRTERLKLEQEIQVEKQAIQSKMAEIERAKVVARDTDNMIADECIANLIEIETAFAGMDGFDAFIQEATALREAAERYKRDNQQGKEVTQELGKINNEIGALALRIQSFAS